jgi:hypothetical protein
MIIVDQHSSSHMTGANVCDPFFRPKRQFYAGCKPGTVLQDIDVPAFPAGDSRTEHYGDGLRNAPAIEPLPYAVGLRHFCRRDHFHRAP